MLPFAILGFVMKPLNLKGQCSNRTLRLVHTYEPIADAYFIQVSVLLEQENY